MITLHSIDQNHSLQERELFYKEVKIQEWPNSVTLATCNRVEVYHGEGFVPRKIVEHLFMVASGLKSSFIGEGAILGQIKLSYKKAADKGDLHKTLHRLFQTALFTGKLVRTETEISRGAMSHAQAAVDLIGRNFLSLDRVNVTFIGTGKLNEAILNYIKSKGIRGVFLGNRSFENAVRLALSCNGQAFGLDALECVLETTDILICSTSAPHLVVKPNHIPPGKHMLILDLAVPRDVDPSIGQLKGIRLFSIEDIEKGVEQNLELRKSHLEKAKEIIGFETDKFMEWQLRQPEFRN